MRGGIPPLPHTPSWCGAQSTEKTFFYFMLCYCTITKSRDSSVGIALVYGLDNWGSRVRFPAGAGNFSLHHRGQNGGPTPPPIQRVIGAASLGVERPGHEADHSPPSSAEVKSAWIYTSTPPIRLHGVVLS
jgi:hypothetical protein